MPRRPAGFKAIELQFPYDVPASQVKAAVERNKLTVLGINTPPGERDGEFGLAAVPGREKDFAGAVCPRARLHHRDRRQRDPLSGRQGRARAAPGGRARIHRQSQARRRSRRGEEHHAADRADQSARPAELFSQSRRTRRRHHRQGRQAERQDPVRFLSCADRRRRSHHPAGEILAACRPSAMCGGADAARAGRGRDQLPGGFRSGRPARLSRAGSAASTGRAAAPKRGWAGAANMACDFNALSFD